MKVSSINVKVRKNQSSKRQQNGNPGEPINENECQFFLVQGLCCNGLECGAAHQKGLEETAEEQGACLTPDIKAQWEKKMLGSLSLNLTLHTSFKHQKCCSVFGLLDILTTNPALIMKILYSLCSLPPAPPNGGRGIARR